jgi:hypothetical protein
MPSPYPFLDRNLLVQTLYAVGDPKLFPLLPRLKRRNRQVFGSGSSALSQYKCAKQRVKKDNSELKVKILGLIVKAHSGKLLY